MKKEILVLLITNIFSAIGYSIIAPLYPALADSMGIGQDVTGLIIAAFAISNVITTPLIPGLMSIFDRKEVFYLAMILEVNNY